MNLNLSLGNPRPNKPPVSIPLWKKLVSKVLPSKDGNQNKGTK